MGLPSRIVVAFLLFAAVLAWGRGAAADDSPRAPPDVVIPSPESLDEALATLDARGIDLLIADAAVMTAQGNAQTSAGIANPQLSFSTGPMLDYSISAPTCISGCSREIYTVGLADNG